jgi:hypothetical protein
MRHRLPLADSIRILESNVGYSKVKTGRLSLRAKRGNLDFGEWRLLRRSAPRNDMVRHLSPRMRKSNDSDRIFENRYIIIFNVPAQSRFSASSGLIFTYVPPPILEYPVGGMFGLSYESQTTCIAGLFGGAVHVPCTEDSQRVDNGWRTGAACRASTMAEAHQTKCPLDARHDSVNHLVCSSPHRIRSGHSNKADDPQTLAHE